MSDRILDQWAGLNHKPIMAGTAANTLDAPSWVPRSERRRLNAYRVLWAYRANTAKEFVDYELEADRAARREYGDADLFVRQVAAATIGLGAQLRVAGAARPPVEPPEGASDADHQEFKRVKSAYPSIVARQRELDRWAEDEQWPLRVNAAEESAVGLGDGVYWLTFSTRRNRVRLRTLDPGFYFPVYPSDGDSDDYPTKVHLAWEFEEDNSAPLVLARPSRWLRRITYELVPVDPYRVGYSSTLATQACLMTDARWNLSNLTGTSNDLTLERAIVNINEAGEEILDLNLGIDFIPVVHVPNLGGDPWGSSVLLSIAQILDDMQIADTDASDAAAVAGGPPIAVAGVTQGEMLKHYGPKTVWELPNGGGASVLDTSKGLASLHEHQDRLFSRASTNSRVPEEILGKVSAAQVPSGLALALSFGPFEVMINQARLVRTFKYQLLLKMVQRIQIAHGAWRGEVWPSTVHFGSAMPSDLAGLADVLMKLTGDQALVSRPTGVQMLRDAGMPIPDVPIEVDRVEAEDFKGANLLYRATRSPALAAEYLRKELPEDVLMDQLGVLLQREVKLDDIRELFEAKKEEAVAPPASQPPPPNGTKPPGLPARPPTGNGTPTMR